jgi:hypothetical protein
MKLGTSARNASTNGVVDLLDVGGGGTLTIYTGSPPADPQTAPSGTLLATLVLSNPAFGSAASGEADANAITDDASADATGTAGWFRLADAAATGIIDGTITATGGGGDIEFNTVSFVAGGVVSIDSLSVNQPEA